MIFTKIGRRREGILSLEVIFHQEELYTSDMNAYKWAKQKLIFHSGMGAIFPAW